MKTLLDKKNKKGAGIVGGIIGGIVGLIILSVVILLIADTINDAGLITDDTLEDNATDDMIANLTSGMDEVSAQIPTILLIAAVVILFGAIAILVARSRSMTGGGTL